MSQKKDQVIKKIEKVIQNKSTVLQDAYTKSLEELVEDLKIYQFELEFQNEELIRIQSELENSRNEWHYLFNHAPLGYVTINDSFIVTACNQTFRSFMGITDDCNEDQDFRKIIHPEDQDRFLMFVRSISKTKEPLSIDIRLQYREKKTDAKLIGKQADQQENIGFLFTVMDITKHKQTESELREAERELKTITDSMTDMIVVANPEGVISYVSPSCKKFGYQQQEMLGMTLFDFVAEDDMERVIETYQHAIDNKLNKAVEFKTKHADGTFSWVETSGTVILDKHNEIIEAVFVVRDISERKETELKLQQTEQFLKRTGKLAAVGGWEYVVNNDNVNWSEVTYRIHEEDPTRQINLRKGIEYYKEGRHRDRITELVARAITEGIPFDDEFILVTARGNERWVRVQGESECIDGECRRLFGSIQDIHDRKLSEIKLEKSEERFRSIFENNHAIMLLINPHSGAIVDANPAAQQFYGYSARALRSMHIQQINTLPVEDIKKEMALAMDGSKKHFNFKHRLSSGAIRDVEVSSGKISLVNEEFLYSIVFDVTDKSQLQKDLKENELRYRSIFQDAQDAILLFDPETLLFTDANPSALELFQLGSVHEVKSFTPIDLSPEIQPDGKPSDLKAKEMVQQAISGKNSFFDWKHKNIHGDEFDAQVLINTVTLAGKKLLQATVRDITTSKKAEIELERYKNRLESLITILQQESTELQEMLNQALDELIKLTDSKYGYIYFYDENKEEFVLNSWSRDVMESCKVAEPQTIYCLTETGFWGEVVRQRKPLINNDFKTSHPLKKGYPEGHVALEKFLSIPVFYNGKIVAVAGVANKLTDYDQSDQMQMTLLMDAVWKTAERMKAEKALKESETKFRIFADSAPIGILILDKSSNITYVSNGFTKIYGYTQKDIPNVDAWMKLAYPNEEIRKRVINNWELAFKEAKVTRKPIPPVEFTVLSKNKREIHTEFRLTSIGEISYVLFTDITARKQAVDNLKQTSAYLENLINNANAPIIVWDADMKITRFNKAFEELSGYKSAQVIGNPLSMLFTSHMLKDTLSLIQPTASGTNLQSVEIEIQCADGSKRIALWNSANIQDNDGIIISTIAQGQDITQRKLAEQQLAESTEQLKELNATKDKLFSIIAHDLRNPFMSLLGISEIMSDASVEFSIEETRQLAANMNHSALSAYNLLENLLEWSRLQRHMLRAEPQFIQIRKMIDALISSHREMIFNKSIHVEVDIEEKLLARIDERMIDSAFRNLLTNAIKFTPESGNITITGHKKGNRKVEISFEDTGIGIPESMLPIIFEVDENKSRKGTDGEISSGLGLIICKELIERNNGSIRVESEEGKGSTFFVELPSY